VEERPLGGLGIHLVKQLMDQVSYERRAGQNVVVLVKRLVKG
jgi:anti-sigma regulatory factor (Ser/Thr protein kinase)